MKRRAISDLIERASRGDCAAQRMLAEKFYLGEGVERCPGRAFGWLLLAARGGDTQAQYLLTRLRQAGMTWATGFE